MAGHTPWSMIKLKSLNTERPDLVGRTCLWTSENGMRFFCTIERAYDRRGRTILRIAPERGKGHATVELLDVEVVMPDAQSDVKKGVML